LNQDQAMISLKGKHALITGSSRGVGQQIALGLAREGCHVMVHGRTEASCKKTMDLLRPFHIKAWPVYGELSEEAQVKKLITQVEALEQPVDILYNNAAIGSTYHQDIWQHSWEEWARLLRVNVMALYSLCGAFVPDMVKRGFGRVINLSSGIRHTPELLPYGVSKWAVDKLTDDLASTLDGTGVRMNTLDPGWLRTDMGGEHAQHPVEAVLPGALAPALIDNDGPNGAFFSAIEQTHRIINP